MDLSAARDSVVDALEEFLTLMNAPCVSHTFPSAPAPILPPIPRLRHLDTVPNLAWIPDELKDTFTVELRAALSHFDVAEGQPCGSAEAGNVVNTVTNSLVESDVGPRGERATGIFSQWPHLGAHSKKTVFFFLVRKDWLRDKYRSSVFHKTMYDMATEKIETQDMANSNVVILDDKHMEGWPRLNPFARITWQVECLAAQASTNADNHVAHYAPWESQPFHDDPDKHPYKLIESIVLGYGHLSFAERIKISVIIFHGYHPVPVSRDLAIYTSSLLEPGYLYPKGFEGKMLSTWTKNRRNNYWEFMRGKDWQV